MEYHNHEPTSVFKVENICCKAFQKKLKKEISKIPGVNKVAVDSDRSLVLVKGQADPMFVTAIIAKLGKNAEILSHDRQPRNNREHVDQEHQKGVHKDCSRQDFDGHNMEENFHRFHDHVNRHGHKIDETFNRFRDHIPPEAGERLCRDEHCKNHHPRNMFCDHMPERGSRDMFGHFAQRHYCGTNFRFRDGHYPFMDDTYLQPPRMPGPIPAYGFISGRPMPAYDNCFTSFGDENAQNCLIM